MSYVRSRIRASICERARAFHVSSNTYVIQHASSYAHMPAKEFTTDRVVLKGNSHTFKMCRKAQKVKQDEINESRKKTPHLKEIIKMQSLSFCPNNVKPEACASGDVNFRCQHVERYARNLDGSLFFFFSLSLFGNTFISSFFPPRHVQCSHPITNQGENSEKCSGNRNGETRAQIAIVC